MNGANVMRRITSMTDLTDQEAPDTGTNEINTGEADAGTQARELSDVEQLAAEMGWKPDGEGVPEEKRKSAAEWIKKEREINRGLKQDMRAMREQLNRMAEAGTKQTQRALKMQADELQAKFEDAVANRDTRGAAQAMQELNNLQAEAVNAAPVASVEKDFATRNPWYNKDEDATAYAQAVSQREHAKGKSPAEQIEAVEAAMRKRFPELMGAAPTKVPAAVNAPGRAVPVKREKSFADLPPDVKRAAESYAKLYKEKFGLDPEQSKTEYAKDYWAGQ